MKVDPRVSTSSQTTTDLDRLVLPLGSNTWEYGRQYTNNSGAEVTITEGMLFAALHADGALIPFDSAATAGTGGEIPRWCAACEQTVANGETIDLPMIDGGDVADRAVTFINPTDTLDTVIPNQGLVRDVLRAQGNIRAVPVDDCTKFDN